MTIVYSLWCAVVLTMCSIECLRVLQSANYRPQRGYCKVFLTPYFAVLVVLTTFSVLWALYFPVKVILCVAYTVAAFPVVFARRKCQLVYTKRIWRMICVQFVLLAVGSYFYLQWWVLFLPVVTLLSWALCLPLDNAIAKKYLRLAQQKLDHSNITVIAITGSYGKTSTKDMLCALLDDSVAPTGSCNTPLGIAKFINGADFSDKKYLVLEFGARKKGDIQQLCALYKPLYGIVTGVCPQHLSTFKTLDNVLATKRELVESLPSNGICVLGDESVYSFSQSGACSCVHSTVKYQKVKVTPNGLSFVVTHGKSSAEVNLPQISLHSANTFGVCMTLCLKLGQSFADTLNNAVRVKQTPHRMHISFNGKFYIIDDSYNASITGVESCVKVLRCFEGTKVAIAQGIVEGGDQRRCLNLRCGELLASVCDTLIVVGKNKKLLAEGAKGKCNVVVVSSLSDAVKVAQPYLCRYSFLLFQNDLPDVVNI